MPGPTPLTVAQLFQEVRTLTRRTEQNLPDDRLTVLYRNFARKVQEEKIPALLMRLEDVPGNEPFDVSEIIHIQSILDVNNNELDTDPQAFSLINGQATIRCPGVFAIEGFRFYSIPETNEDGADILLARHPRLVIYGLIWEVYNFQQDDPERLAVAAADYDRALRKAKEEQFDVIFARTRRRGPLIDG